MCLFQIPLIHATVAPAFIPGSTHPCHGSSLVYAGLPYTNEHLREHENLTPNLLSPRPGWNRRWCYHRSTPITLCDNHSIISRSSYSAIWHKPTSYGRIHKRAFSGHKCLHSTSFCPLSRPGFRHFALLNAVFQLHIEHFANFSAWRYCKSRIYARFCSGISSNF